MISCSCVVAWRALADRKYCFVIVSSTIEPSLKVAQCLELGRDEQAPTDFKIVYWFLGLWRVHGYNFFAFGKCLVKC